MDNRLASIFSVENKIFEFRRQKFGVRVSEKHHGRRWEISLLKDDFIRWIHELLQIWRNLVPLIRTRRASGFVLILRLCQNIHGRFFTLEKLHSNGGSVAIRFLEGKKGAGWGLVINAAQKIGPCVEFVSTHSSTVVDESEYLVCRKCGSRDISKVLPKEVMVSPVETLTEKGENGYGRSEELARNQATVSFGDLPPFPISNSSQYTDFLNRPSGSNGARNGAQPRVSLGLSNKAQGVNGAAVRGQKEVDGLPVVQLVGPTSFQAQTFRRGNGVNPNLGLGKRWRAH